MKKRMKASKNRRTTYILLALAAVLLLMSGVGSTRAALTYFSENYTAEITVSQIGVTLLENDKPVSRRDYNKDDWEEETNAGKDAVSGALLQEMIPEGEELVLNKTYKEELAVHNSGNIDEYVRVRIYKYWMDKNGKKETSLSPDLIHLNLIHTDKWIKGQTNSAERTELYYKGILPAGAKTELFADTIRIDGELAKSVEIHEDKETHVITMIYKYDGVEFHVDVEVDAVQTHNAQDAIKSAWGVDATELGIL